MYPGVISSFSTIHVAFTCDFGHISGVIPAFPYHVTGTLRSRRCDSVLVGVLLFKVVEATANDRNYDEQTYYHDHYHKLVIRPAKKI